MGSYSDYWCKRIKHLTKAYVKHGMHPHAANEKATQQVRAEIAKDQASVLERFQETKRLGRPFIL